MMVHQDHVLLMVHQDHVLLMVHQDHVLLMVHQDHVLLMVHQGGGGERERVHQDHVLLLGPPFLLPQQAKTMGVLWLSVAGIHPSYCWLPMAMGISEATALCHCASIVMSCILCLLRVVSCLSTVN